LDGRGSGGTDGARTGEMDIQERLGSGNEPFQDLFRPFQSAIRIHSKGRRTATLPALPKGAWIKMNGDCAYDTELGLAGWCVVERGHIQAECRLEMEWHR